MNQPRLNLETELPTPAAVNVVRDRAIQQVTQHAEDYRPGFGEQAREFILSYLHEHGKTSGEELTIACKNAGIVPPDDRSFGGVYVGLAKRGLIEKVGSVNRLRGHNCAGGNVWDLKR